MSNAPVALVTGANRGLGLESCRQLAEAGYRVLLTSRDERQGHTGVKALSARGLGAEFRQLDVADSASIARLARALRDDGIVLDVLVNNAAVALQGFNAELAQTTIATNFFGVMNVTDALADLIADGGTIVMVSSGMGGLSGLDAKLRRQFDDTKLTRDRLAALMDRFVADVAAGCHEAEGWPSSAYRVSKIGLNALTRLLAEEFALRRIRVNAVCPGWVRTRMGGSSASRAVETGAGSIVWAARLTDRSTGGFYRDGKPLAW